MLHFRAPPVGLGLPPSKLCLLPRRSNGDISLLARRVGEDGLLPTKEGRRSIIEPRGESDDKRFSVLRLSVTGVARCSQVTEALGAAGDLCR